MWTGVALRQYTGKVPLKRLFEALARDARFALRALRRARALSAAAAVVLALGIGANVSIFSVVNALLVRPLPFAAPDRLALIFETLSGRRSVRLTVSAPAFESLRASGVFEQVAAVARTPGSLDLGAHAQAVTVAHATSDLLALLGAEPALGRAFGPLDDQPGGERVALVSDALFRGQLKADPALIGQAITLDGVQRRVIGVLPPRLSAFFPGEVWTPLRFTPEQLLPERREYGLVLAVARLKPGMSAQEAQEKLAALSAERPSDSGRGGFFLEPLHEAFLGELEPALLLLMAAVGSVLLIACANVANLLLGRAAARQKELAVRAALGADRLALARQLLVEALMLAALGCVPGLLLALWAIEVLAPLGSDAIRSAGVEVDGRVLAFALCVTALSGLLAGLVPAWQATRPDLAAQLKDGTRRTTALGRRRVRDALVVIEVAVALVLLLAAGHDFLAFRRLLEVDPGFQAQGALAMEISLPPSRFADPAAQGRFFTELLRRVPGAGFVLQVPLGGAQSVWHFDVEGPGGRGSGHVVDQLQVMSPGAPAALGIPLVSGRAFAPGETGPVALVNQAFARRYWPGEDAVGHRVRPYRYHFEDASGRRFWPLEEPAWFTVVGVLGDVRAVKLSLEPRPEVTLPLSQFPLPEGAVVARGVTAPALRAALSGLDPDLAPQRVASLSDIVAASAEQRRDPMILLSLLATLALLMAGMGLYAAMSWEVAERGRELSIRMALGADSVRVLRLLLTEGLLLAALGIALGFGAALLLRQPLGLVRLEAPLLFALPGALLLVALCACWLPARRAARIDPRVAFRLD